MSTISKAAWFEVLSSATCMDPTIIAIKVGSEVLVPQTVGARWDASLFLAGYHFAALFLQEFPKSISFLN